MPNCNSCHQYFEDFKSLALHISCSKKGHKKGKKWAAKYLLINGLSASKKRDFKERTPLSDEEKETKRSLGIKVSGRQNYERTQCPHCNQITSTLLPIEYISSSNAWRTIHGKLQILCSDCRK